MREAVGEVAVVRQQKRAGRVRIEPPDRHDARRMRDEVDDGAASLRISRRRDDAGRLVEQDVGEPLLRERLAVEADVVVAPTNVFSCPGSPFTVTRPALIRSSAFRREATPARAR